MIMKCTSLVALGALTLSLAGCATTQVQSDYDPNFNFSQLSTYSWAERTSEGKDPAVYNNIVESRVKVAVNQALKAKGFSEVASNPSFLVAWHGAINQEHSINTVGTEYGYGWGWYGGWGGPGMMTSTTYVSTWNEGTLIIDIVDAKANKMVWRGSAQSELDEHQNDPQKMQEALNEAVDKMMATFPPSSGSSK
jgi:hypothetical protein